MRQIYAIRDNAVNELTPHCFIASHDAHAIRVFQEMAADQRSPIGRYLDDHDLVIVGSLDTDATGEILDSESRTNVNALQPIITGKALRAASAPQDAELKLEA